MSTYPRNQFLLEKLGSKVLDNSGTTNVYCPALASRLRAYLVIAQKPSTVALLFNIDSILPVPISYTNFVFSGQTTIVCDHPPHSRIKDVT